MRFRVLLILLAGLLPLGACSPVSTPEAEPMPTATPLATEAMATPVAEPVATATPLTPTEAPAVPAATPTKPVSTEPPAMQPAEGEGNADVMYVRAVQGQDGSWTFHVTVQHPDTGWEDYADGWDVVLPDGTVVKPDQASPFTRLLLHPHENEQPFTRSQSGIVIPPEVTEVHVRAHDLVDGFGGRVVVVDLTTSSGPDYEVER